MPSFSSRLSQDIEKFYPNETLLPKNAFAKGVLFTLGVVGFATMFLQPSVAQDGGNLSVDTSLTNNIMSVGKLSVINWSTTSVILDSNGIQLPSETSTTTLLKLVNKYIKPSALTGSDIGPNMITTEKILDGTISCQDLSPQLNTLLCNGNSAPTLSCAAGSYLIGITTGAGAICTGGAAGGLPPCGAWQSVMRNSSTSKWDCYTPSTGYSASWVSLWTEWDIEWTIYNKNLTGKVGIGMTSPSATLSVGGSLLVKGGASSVLYVTGANGGRVGILTSNPLYPLDVIGSIRASAYLATSDARLKTNISAIPDALGKLLGINWYTYNLKSDGSFHYWVIAQEIETIFPYLVSTDENGMKSVNYNGLVAPIIESIKTLNTKMDTLEIQLDTNTSRIEALEKLQK